ncbi:MAG: MBL fold metallo-hydrolase [Marinilabiliaceae bacterium]|nr:MBL fold metallo-hydrolase [Marinilabiliaceae bacterium]
MKQFFLSLITLMMVYSCSCDKINMTRHSKNDVKRFFDARQLLGFGEEVDKYLNEQKFECDTFIVDSLNKHDISMTISGKKYERSFYPFLNVFAIKHGTLMFNFSDMFIIHVDPVGMFGVDYTKMPKADMILITHEHHDHLDSAAIAAVATDETLIYSNKRVAELSSKCNGLEVGDTITGNWVNIIAVPSYNTTEGHTAFHPKGRDLGFIIEVFNREELSENGEKSTQSTRIYVAGDTEPIEEMKSFGKIDIAFIPVNQPYTMTPEQAIEAIEMIKPAIVYPYHYGETDLSSIVEHFKDSPDTEVRIRQLQ